MKKVFVPVSNSYDVLKCMNDACPDIIAKDGDAVVGYALVMLKEFNYKIPILYAKFKTANRLFGDTNYLAMGQIRISKEYRQQEGF